MIAPAHGMPARLSHRQATERLAMNSGYNFAQPDGIDPDYDDTWPTYIDGGRTDPELRQALFLYYRPIISVKLAKRYAMRSMPYASLQDGNDLQSLADIGLWEAVDSFEIARGWKFETFATTRVRGSMIDGLRSMQNFTRLISQVKRVLAPLMEAMYHELGRKPTLDEVAERYPYQWVGKQYLKDLLHDPLVSSSVFNQSANSPDDDKGTGQDYRDKGDSLECCMLSNSPNRQDRPSDRINRMDLIQKILKLLAADSGEMRVIHYYFFCGMTSSRIAEITDNSPTWVSTKKQSALAKLRIAARDDPQFAEQLMDFA